jgi:hypothetical protein
MKRFIIFQSPGDPPTQTDSIDIVDEVKDDSYVVDTETGTYWAGEWWRPLDDFAL